MRKVARLAICNAFSNESLFDIDYGNSYSMHGPHEFFSILSQSKTCTPPVFSHQELAFCHKKCDEILLLLIFNHDDGLRASDKISMIEFSGRFIKVCKDFLGTLSIENIIANITLLAEIVDCILIGGFVHLTNTAKIRGFLSQTYVLPTSTQKAIPRHHSSVTPPKLAGPGHQPEGQTKVVPTTPSAAAKEHLYIDLIETLDFNISQSGGTTCTIHGVLNTNNATSGEKTLSLQLNKNYSKVIGQHSFNRCVNSSEFNTTGLLNADIPLGQTQLLTYQLTSDDLPFTMAAVKGSSGGEVKLTLNCAVPASVMCLNVAATLSLTSTSRGLLKLSSMARHSLELNDDKQSINWNIPEIAGQTHTTAHFKILPDGQGDFDLTKTIDVSYKFEVSNYLHSTCKINSIKVQHSKPVTKWIRHLTIAGDCHSCLQINQP